LIKIKKKKINQAILITQIILNQYYNRGPLAYVADVRVLTRVVNAAYIQNVVSQAAYYGLCMFIFLSFF